MLIDAEGKNGCVFVVAKAEIAAVGWNINDIECFNQSSESFSKMMALLMRIYTSHMDEKFLEYADSEFNGVPISVAGRIGADVIDFRFGLLGDFTNVFHLAAREIRPLWEYISEYGYDADECSDCSEICFDECEDDCDDDCGDLFDEDDYTNRCLIYFDELNDIMRCCSIIVASNYQACESSLVKTENGMYALLCCFPDSMDDKTLNAYDKIMVEFSSKMEYDDARIAYVLEHATQVISESAIAKLNEVTK